MEENHETLEPSMASPPLKKPRTSTSDSEPEPEPESHSAPSAELPRRYKRRKVAMLVAYCGYGYQGMQKNPGAKTIEGDFEEALFRAGAVPEADKNAPRRFDWARAARTDKGVSAAAQVVSGRFIIDPPGFVERLNEQLADQIHVFGYKRVTGAFNAKKFCDRRRYIYFLPVFALDPSAHPDREAVMASLGSGNELAKCLECSERGRKIPKELIDEKQPQNTDIGEINGQSGSNTEEKTDLDTIENSNGEESGFSKRSVFSYGDTEKERFNRILKYYEGTHNFHNFTTRIKAEDPSAKRFIISFTANTVVTLDGIDFVKCEVIGQSFMLHQIRKMIGFAVAIMRNCAPESLMDIAFNRDTRINVPTAPEVGLFLDECMFTSYNNKWKNTHEEVSMKDYEDEAEKFKMKYIYPHIAMMEHKEGAVSLWLHSLNRRNYPDFGFLDKKVENGGEGLKEGEMEKNEDLSGEERKELKEENLGNGESEKNEDLGGEERKELKEENLGNGESEKKEDLGGDEKMELKEENLGNGEFEKKEDLGGMQERETEEESLKDANMGE